MFFVRLMDSRLVGGSALKSISGGDGKEKKSCVQISQILQAAIQVLRCHEIGRVVSWHQVICVVDLLGEGSG